MSRWPRSRSYAGWEDVYGLAIASVLIAVGVYLLRTAGILTGGTVGLSLLVSKMTGVSYSVLSVALNLPIFLFGWRAMGWKFVGKSLVVTISTAVLVAWLPNWLGIVAIKPAFAAIAGGTIVGMGALAAARHGAAAGGTLVLVLWLQRRFNINGGSTQLAADLIIASLAALLLGWLPGLWSALGIFATDAMIIAWHRPQQEKADARLAGTP